MGRANPQGVLTGAVNHVVVAVAATPWLDPHMDWPGWDTGHKKMPDVLDLGNGPGEKTMISGSSQMMVKSLLGNSVPYGDA
jgi:hypothetical protein